MSYTQATMPRISIRVHGRTATVLREIALLTGLLGIYEGARLAGGHDVGRAFQNAGDVLRLEQWLRLPSELDVQHALLHVQFLVRAANLFYAGVHLPITALTLAWLLLRRPDVYRRTRTALIGATGVALAVYLLVPVAPPRMMPGFVDAAAVYGQSVYGDSGGKSLANQYAAMPSLHVGWSVLIAVAMISAAHTGWRWLWLLHPILTVLVVVSTGNHYWLDGVAGAALVLVAFGLAGRRQRGQRGQERWRPGVQALRATPTYTELDAGSSPTSSDQLGRHCEAQTRPGSTRSQP
jgi:hypothetical protein